MVQHACVVSTKPFLANVQLPIQGSIASNTLPHPLVGRITLKETAILSLMFALKPPVPYSLVEMEAHAYRTVLVVFYVAVHLNILEHIASNTTPHQVAL